MSRFLRWYSNTYRHWPFTLAFATCFVKGSIADGITQKKLERTDKFDWKRNGRFATWSGAYCGCVQHFVYNTLYTILFPSASATSKIACTLFDCLVHVPFGYFPAYYLSKSVMLGDTAKHGFDEYWNYKWTILMTYWKIWPPVVFCVMFFVPFQFRVGVIGIVSLFWLILLSYLSPMTDRPDIEIPEEITEAAKQLS